MIDHRSETLTSLINKVAATSRLDLAIATFGSRKKEGCHCEPAGGRRGNP